MSPSTLMHSQTRDLIIGFTIPNWSPRTLHNSASRTVDFGLSKKNSSQKFEFVKDGSSPYQKQHYNHHFHRKIQGKSMLFEIYLPETVAHISELLFPSVASFQGNVRMISSKTFLSYKHRE